MATLDDLFDRDPDLFIKAGLTTRLALERTLRNVGMSAGDAADTADRIVVELGDLPSVVVSDSDVELDTILDKLANRFSQVIEQSTDPASLGQQVATLGATIAMSGHDGKSKSRWTLLAFALYLANPVTFTFESGRGLEISNAPLVEAITKRMLDTVDRAIEAWKEAELARRQPAGQGAGELGKQPTGARNPTSRDEMGSQPSNSVDAGKSHDQQISKPVTSPVNAAGPTGPSRQSVIISKDHAAAQYKILTESNALAEILLDSDEDQLFQTLEQYRVPVGGENFGIPDRTLAMKLRDHVRDRLSGSLLTRDLPAQLHAELFVEQPAQWERAAAIIYDVGLIPVRQSGSTSIAYRLAVRLQSAASIRRKPWRQLHGALDRVLRGVGSIRQLREVRTLAGGPGGSKRGPWRKGESRIRHGHSIGTEAGRPGTVTAISRDLREKDYLLITAGHVVGDRLAPNHGAGLSAYCPAYEEGLDEHPIGIVDRVHLYRRPWDALGDPAANWADEFDVASIVVRDVGRLAAERLRRAEGIFPLTRRTAPLTDEDFIAGKRLILGAGFTPPTKGRVTAIDTTAVITDTRTARIVCGSGLIELAVEDAAAEGDSGKPCYDEAGNLLGLVVAGTPRGHIDTIDSKARPLVYMQPVHDLFTKRQWELI